MKLLAIITTVVCTSSALAAVLQRGTVAFDETSDILSGTRDSVDCSRGDRCLLTLGLHTLSDIPNLPFIGDEPDVASRLLNCGACFRLRYRQNMIHMMAVDLASNFNIAKSVIDALTDGRAEQLDRIPISVVRVHPSFCGGQAGRIINARPDLGQPGRVIDLGQPGRVIDLGQPGRVIDLGQPGRVIDLGQPGTVIDLGQRGRGIDLGQPGTVIDLGQRGRGIDLGQPGTVIDLGQPGRGINVGQPGRVIASDQRLHPEEINQVI